MARKKQTRGACVYCGKEMTRGGLVRHLKTCNERKQAIASADEQKQGLRQYIYHLQVQNAWGGDYWLHLEMNGETKLNVLDHYLRAIWLECCGHLSRFSVGGGWGGREVGMGTITKRILQPGLTLNHIYDFGTESETLVKVVDVRTGRPTIPNPIALMARNEFDQPPCIECGKPANWLCIECLYEEDVGGALCDEHAETHPHDDYGSPMPLFNSPRVGMCGYDGPAEPPY
ncbi:MAG: hypothetical protein GY759_02010 [Chloroflexi bacterium]|nr:hypothetical protein [Chloroflexota bacterium]